jgi:hypothetical protein
MNTPEDETMIEEDEYFTYLDTLRDSGVTNMFGAAPYLIEQFGVNRQQARDILLKWMDTFEIRHPRD